MTKLGSFVLGLFSGLRCRLLFLVLLVCSPLIGLTLQKAWTDRRHALGGFRQRAIRLNQVAERNEIAFLSEARQLMLSIAEAAPVRAGSRGGTERLLGELFSAYPRYANLTVTRTNGELIASARFPAAPSSAAERALLQRVVQGQDFAVADRPVRPPIGTATLSVACPVFDRAGNLSSVVLAALSLDWFDRFGTDLGAQVPKAASWTQIDLDGRILSRYPRPDRWIGRSLPDTALLQAITNGASGVIEAPNRAGVPTVYVCDTLSSLVSGRALTLLAIPKQALYASSDQALAQSLAWLGVAMFSALAIGWVGSTLLILRPVSALVHSSARLATGDFSTRTGLPHGRDELGRLTLSFDQMAQALQQRERDRQLATQQLHLLSQRLVQVQEAERRHIARELHDEIGQSLTVAEMNLHAALETPTGPAVARRLRDTADAIERVLHQVQDLSLSLRPSLLDDLGLEPALRWYTNRQAALTGLTCEFQADSLERRLDPLIETACFRIAQEALTNVARHARARAILVQLRLRQGQLHLLVQDDGCGFQVTNHRRAAIAGASLGLLSMEERADLAGGGLEFLSTPDRGTQVHAWFPLRWKLDVA